MISRRNLLLSSLAAGATPGTTIGATGKMMLALHQNTSAGAGYRKSLEGWARAGIKNVEITNGLLDDFVKTDSLDAAKRVITDNGRILRKLADKGYSGSLSVELFLPKFQQGNPYEIARESRQKAENVMRQAKV